mgnify:CR=1 FL=1
MRIFLLTVFTFLSLITIVNAQNSSPYTRYGVGDLDYGYSAKMMSIGDLGVTQLDPDHIIITNPASWASFNKTRIEFGLGYKGISISNNSDKFFTSETDFKGFTFGFPVSTEYGIGVAFGLVPYSRVSYKAVKNFTSLDNSVPSYKVNYEGKGGISKLFVGSSVNLPLGFIGGVSLDYYFGNLEYFSDIEFDANSSNINTSYNNNRRSTGFGSSVGIISPDLTKAINVQPISDLRLGISINYISKLNTDTILTSTSFSLVDTIARTSTKMSIPIRINSGISFVLSEMYHFNFDYAYQPWGEFKLGDVKSDNLRNAQKFSAAFEYIPKRNIGMSTWEQIVWRGGLSYEETQYKFNGSGINQFSVFGGLSFPMGADNSIDLGLQYALRGTKDNNLLQENFVKLYIGVSFGELWFLRYEK